MSARKLRLVADTIRGKNYEEALAILKFLPKRKAANIFTKLLMSAAQRRGNHRLRPG